MIINSQNLDGIFHGFNTLFNKGYESVTPQYDKVCMIVPSSSRDETYGWMGQMPQLREWINGREIQSFCTNSYTIKNRDFELTIGVSRNDVMDDNIGIYTPIFKNMGESARLHPDELVFPLLASGFKEKCYDNTPFFGDKHPLTINEKQETVQSNIGTKKLSAASYAAARAQMMMLKGENGRSLKVIPDLLVVSPYNEAKAREILFSDLIHGSTNINKNTCDLLVVPELADDPEQWFLLSTKRSLRPIVFQEREKPHFTSKTKDTDDNVFYDNRYLYGVNARYNAGFGLWQLAFGSTGIDGEVTATGVKAQGGKT